MTTVKMSIGKPVIGQCIIEVKIPTEKLASGVVDDLINELAKACANVTGQFVCVYDYAGCYFTQSPERQQTLLKQESG